METEYQTLQTIFNIVKNDPHPETYLCSAREIILRQLQGWETIEQHLQALVKEDLVIVKQLDKIVISITPSGIEKAKSIAPSHNSISTFPKA